MNSPADSIANYISAKDSNRPHLLERAFTKDVSLNMNVQTDAITFPPSVIGREAVADTLVRRFGQTYENIYTFCLCARPLQGDRALSCGWLVAMSEKQAGAVRVGCGRYDWSFSSTDSRVDSLAITISAMEVLPAAALGRVMNWVQALPYPWCAVARAELDAPDIPEVKRVLQRLRQSGA